MCSGESVRLRASPDLRWRTWAGESVVFDPASGDTHLLDPVAAEALACLQAQALNAAECGRRLAQRLDIDVDPQLQRYVEHLLAQFEERGLLDPVPG